MPPRATRTQIKVISCFIFAEDQNLKRDIIRAEHLIEQPECIVIGRSQSIRTPGRKLVLSMLCMMVIIHVSPLAILSKNILDINNACYRLPIRRIFDVRQSRIQVDSTCSLQDRMSTWGIPGAPLDHVVAVEEILSHRLAARVTPWS